MTDRGTTVIPVDGDGHAVDAVCAVLADLRHRPVPRDARWTEGLTTAEQWWDTVTAIAAVVPTPVEAFTEAATVTELVARSTTCRPSIGLRGQYVSLRPPRPEDTDLLRHLATADDPRWERAITPTAATMDTFFATTGEWCLLAFTGGDIVGLVRLYDWSLTDRTARLALLFEPSIADLAAATEATLLTLRHVFAATNATWVHLEHCSADEPRLPAIARTIGTETVRLHDHLWRGDRYHDLVLRSVHRTVWVDARMDLTQLNPARADRTTRTRPPEARHTDAPPPGDGITMTMRRLVAADLEWLSLIPGSVPALAWAEAEAAGLWSPAAIHLNEQPVGAVAVAAIDHIHRTAHIAITGPQQLAPLIPLIFQHYAELAGQALELRKIYLEWDWPWPPPPALDRIAVLEGHQPANKLTAGTRHGTFTYVREHPPLA